MQSSYKVIKSSSVLTQGDAKIDTSYNKVISNEGEGFAKDYIDNYENLAKTLLENSRKKGEELISKAYAQAQDIEEQAYKKGYEEGYNDGNRQGYEDVYNQTIGEAQKEAENIKKQIEENMLRAREDYEIYLKDKENEIKSLAILIAENILKREIKNDESLNSMIFDAISKYKNSKVFIIKCNSHYIDRIRENINDWREKLAFTGDIFTIEDNSIDNGCILIEKNNGSIYISVDEALARVKEAFFS